MTNDKFIQQLLKRGYFTVDKKTGEVRKSTGQVVKGSKRAASYIVYMIHDFSGIRRCIQLHRLVAFATLKLPKNVYDLQVNHKDGNKHNYRPSNLEWVTPKENVRHAIASKLNTNRGQNHGSSLLSDKDVLNIRKQAAKGLSRDARKALASKYNLSDVRYSQIIRGASWKHLLPVGYIPAPTRSIGEDHGAARLNERQAKTIMLSEKTDEDLALAFKVTTKTVDKIRRGITWKHLYAKVSRLQEFSTLKHRRRIYSFWRNNNVTEKQATEILRSTKSNIYFAEKFKLPPTQIWKVRNGHLWSWFRKSVSGKAKLSLIDCRRRLTPEVVAKAYTLDGWYVNIARLLKLDAEKVRMIRTKQNYTMITKRLKRGREMSKKESCLC